MSIDSTDQEDDPSHLENRACPKCSTSIRVNSDVGFNACGSCGEVVYLSTPIARAQETVRKYSPRNLRYRQTDREKELQRLDDLAFQVETAAASREEHVKNDRDLSSPRHDRLQHEFLMKKHDLERKLSKTEEAILDHQIRMHDSTIKRLQNRKEHVRRARDDVIESLRMKY